MKQNGESRKEAIQPTNLLVVTRRITRVGTWNVQTMYEASKAADISAERKAYHLDIIGLCETRWTVYGEQPLSPGDTIIYSGHVEKVVPQTLRVGIMMSSYLRSSLIYWKPRA